MTSSQLNDRTMAFPHRGRAVVLPRFGPANVLVLSEVEQPRPRPKELVVRVRATSVTRGDLIARRFGLMTAREFSMPRPIWFAMRSHFGTRTPRVRILGSEFSGTVEAVGRDVTSFSVGQCVFGNTGMAMGAYADYVRVPEGGTIALKPSSLSDAEAATATAGTLTALRLLRRLRLEPDQRVLILGASGGIGSAAVQIAKNVYGARVTGVGGPRSLEYIRSLGAEAAHDYTTYDPGATLEPYAVIVDVLGKGSFGGLRHLLERDGVYVYVSFKTRHVMQMLGTRLESGKRVICALALGPASDMEEVRDLVSSGQVRVAVDRCFPLVNAAQAHAYVESGQKVGHVALIVDGEVSCADGDGLDQ